MKTVLIIEGDICGIGDGECSAKLDCPLSYDDLIDIYILETTYLWETLLGMTEHGYHDCTEALYEELQNNMLTPHEMRNGIARLPGEIVLESERVEDLEKAGQTRIEGV